jgi:hypothetical protein
MRPLSYSLEFRGVALETQPRELAIRATAPSSSFLTVVSEWGLEGFSVPFGPEGAVLDVRLAFFDAETFAEEGFVAVGRGNLLRFRTVDRARLTASADPHLRQAALILLIEGGEGQFAEATGQLTSNLLISDTLEVTDTHVGLIHIRPRGRDTLDGGVGAAQILNLGGSSDGA